MTEAGTTPGPVEPTSGSPEGDGCPARPRRRAFLRGALGAGVAGAAAAGYGLGSATSAAASTGEAAGGLPDRLPAVAFHGPHQAGILPKPAAATAVVSFNVTADGRGELTELLRTITARARLLSSGWSPPPTGISAPPNDSGIVGPRVQPDGLTITVGVGSTLFDDRFGLADRKPRRLAAMTTFPDDALDPAQCGGDLSMQFSAGHTDTVLHALRDVARHTRGGMQAQWRIDGFSAPGRPTGTTPRNLLGFMDGIANPDVGHPALMDKLVWVANPASIGEPSWTAGGSYQVIRLIRMLPARSCSPGITASTRVVRRARMTA